MRNIENEFFTLYKSVDAICRDMFAGKHFYNDKGEEVFGLSAYIKTMETESYTYRAVFPEWDVQYKKLKRLRWIRSQIAHEVGVSECSESDLYDLKLFYKQLMTQNDILAAAYRWKKSQKQAKKASKLAAAQNVPKQTKTPYSATPYTNPASQKESKRSSSWLWLFGIAVVIIIVAYLIIKSSG